MKKSKRRLLEIMQRVDPTFKPRLNEAPGDLPQIDVVLDFANDTTSISVAGNEVARDFQPTEEGLYAELYNLYKNGRRYFNLVNVKYSVADAAGNEKWDEYEMDIMSSNIQNLNYVAKDLKDNINELFIEINAFSK
jgi:hypothetical protein